MESKAQKQCRIKARIQSQKYRQQRKKTKIILSKPSAQAAMRRKKTPCCCCRIKQRKLASRIEMQFREDGNFKSESLYSRRTMRGRRKKKTKLETLSKASRLTKRKFATRANFLKACGQQLSDLKAAQSLENGCTKIEGRKKLFELWIQERTRHRKEEKGRRKREARQKIIGLQI